MMDFTGIQEIQQRIAEIQKKFNAYPMGMPQANGQKFQNALQSELEKGKTTAAVPAASTQRNGVSSTAAKAFAEAGGVTGGGSSGSIAGMIQAAAKKYGVDPRLVTAVAETESGENQNAVSDAGAIGVMQLMPDTAASLGVNPYDEKQNIEGGTKYLKQMIDSFGGDVKKAVAAYNAGAQAVRDYNGVPPYRETQNYVNKVLDLYQ